ncbi:DEAD/DEAH box helicase [Candidatus Dojkabacteria bacterium]|nr:DEAD/DEAH box helicase [Candidatus Dojkabacteria bacterium]
MAGDLLRSIDSCQKEKSVPWIFTEINSPVREILEIVSKLSSKRIVVFQLRNGVDLSEVAELDFHSLEFRNEFLLEKDVGFGDFVSVLEDFGFRRENKVWGQHEFSVVGDVVTFWPIGHDRPIRVESDDQKVTNISVIDPGTRRTISKINSLHVLGSKKDVSGEDDIMDDYFEVIDIGSRFTDTFEIPVIVSDISPLKDELDFRFNLLNLDFRNTEWGEEKIRNALRSGWDVLFVINHNNDRALQIKEGFPEIKIFEEDLASGFESEQAGVIVLTDQELWGTVKLGRGAKPKDKFTGLVAGEISPGEYVVHEDHGVALYTGINVQGDEKYLELKYAKEDRLLVPFNVAGKITKYVGVGGFVPKLTRLGGGEWKRIRTRVKKSVRKLAMQLLRLYALREMAKSEALKTDISDLKSFESDFPFVETEDQIQAIEEVKSDLGKGKPMDRLLVGDVGFGKTEVAMRAAFISVSNGKQVAVLAPTTVLVEQHYNVFKSRMEKYGINVAALSRFLGEDEAQDVVDRVAQGKVDIVVGTHRLLSKDVSFKDLGLLVIDEEQKFGVSQKEKLKGVRVDTHVLSMSATPIPRTLNMALSGVRDISVIATPPIGRKPVKNVVGKFNWNDVKEAILEEVKRGGQVYYVHNRVRSIENIKAKLQELLPKVRFVVGHGQMGSDQLSKVMRDFNERKYDVLICSTIIENGLDMPNVNTLVVDRAEMFGLAQLYQLRGRVGRGLTQAHAYFFYHGVDEERLVRREFSESGTISDEEGLGDKVVLWKAARQRLNAIRQLEELGSGFGLAQKDLEIRGAGNFLGREQHGNVSSIGFTLYCRLLGELVEEMKNNEGSIPK